YNKRLKGCLAASDRAYEQTCDGSRCKHNAIPGSTFMLMGLLGTLCRRTSVWTTQTKVSRPVSQMLGHTAWRLLHRWLQPGPEGSLLHQEAQTKTIDCKYLPRSNEPFSLRPGREVSVDCCAASPQKKK